MPIHQPLVKSIVQTRSKDAPNFHIDERGSLQETTEGIALDVKRNLMPG